MSINYKETLNLPKTEFPMKADLVKREPERLRGWEANGLYARIQESRRDAPLFVLHDGPPFANGDVHMGTALNKILKDFVVKSKTMGGFRAPFVPGWDCHGLPIEFKVVKESRGLAPAEVRRRSEEYARKFIDVQRRQFKRLGVFGDWENPYLTLAPGYEAEIVRAFATFVEKGLVYRSKKPVYWSTGAQTALAEAEVEYAEREDPAVFVKFPIVSGPLAEKSASMVIWTTTPWTLPANVAIAVHPGQEYVLAEFGGTRSRASAPPAPAEESLSDSERVAESETRECGPLRAAGTPPLRARAAAKETPEDASLRLLIARPLLESFQQATDFVLEKELASFKGDELAGSQAQHPFLERRARILSAEFVTMDTGTGAVHMAPGHGADDYIAGVQHGLPILSPVDDHGRFTEEVGVPAWVGKYVFDANADVIALLRENGALLAEEKYTHSYPHCWRSKTPVVFRAVEQFFLKINALRGEALAAIDGVEWLPPAAKNRIRGTVESRPDWCISRQRAWGVPLPVFYESQSGAPILDAALARKVADIFEQRGTNSWFEQTDAEWAQMLDLPPGITRRNDTLDVWIDSGISHTAVVAKHPELGGPGRPADMYLEATDQHRGWFQSSLLTSIAMHGRAPYRTVVTHGFVVDKDTRKKVSKSEQGTYKKPMNAEHFVEKHGADIVRLWAASVQFTDEVPFSEESFALISDAYRQFRNTLRILLANLADFDETRDAATIMGAGEAGGIEFCERGADGSAIGGTMIDRWVLSRLQEVIATCREAYAAYDFRKVFQTLNQFCTVDLSALYVDITKDRLYCDAPNSPRRRATQTAMHRVFDALARLLAPILVFTMDEAWSFFGKPTSVHLETFPESREALRDPALEQRIETLLRLRGVIAQAVEPARQAGKIGKALEGAVTLEIADDAVLKSLGAGGDELEEFFILSELTLARGEETRASIVPSPHKKCVRCWRHRASVGANAEQPEVCERCADVVARLPARGSAGPAAPAEKTASFPAPASRA